MRSKTAHAVGASILLSLSLLCGCALDDANDFDVSSDESLLETHGSAGPLAKRSVSLSTGITMTYLEAGASKGDALILLHGLGESSRSFSATIQALVNLNTPLHVFALDLRGHGGSSMPTGASCSTAPETCFEISDLAADVVAFMEKKNIRRAHIVGHAMGGMIAQEMAFHHVSYVWTIGLIGSAATGIGNPTINALLTPTIEQQWRGMLEQQRPGFRWPQDAYLLTPRDADPNADSWMAANWLADPVADPGFVTSMVPEAATTRLGAWIGVTRSMATYDARPSLWNLQTPALVLWGRQDDVFLENPDQVELRTALLASVNGCVGHYYAKTYGAVPLPASGVQESDIGHHTHWDAPAMVAADINFWAAHWRPTTDLPYSDPANIRNILVAPGVAPIIAQPRRVCSVLPTK